MLELQASPKEVMRAVEALREFGVVRGIPENELFGPMLSLEECGSNIVDHALHRNERETFRVNIEYAGDLLTIELRDRGRAFDPTSLPTEPPLRADADELGGWGVRLVRRYMDEIKYRREAGENILTLTKSLSRSKNLK
jgi:anti-sigma regulatory factor (Ser/Thr protein kinase)